MDINETEILIKIKIGNTQNSKILNEGDTYYLNMPRNSFICEVIDELYKSFSGEGLLEIKKYRLYTKNILRLYNTNMLIDTFTDIDDINQEICKKGENVFYMLVGSVGPV